MSSCENVLYHYCRTDTFMKILHNKTIRVSDCSKSNDYSETRWIATLFMDTIIDTITNDSEFCKIYNFDDQLRDLVCRDITSIIENVFLKNTREMFTFISCFSEEGDILSQWRGYADDGKGLSIGFNKDLLLTFDTKRYNYFFKKIIYDEEAQVQYIKKPILHLINDYKSIEDESDLPKLLNEFLRNIYLRIVTFRNDSSFFKNSAFSEEKEWRLIINNHYAHYNREYKNSIDEIDTTDENYSERAELNNGFVRYPLQFTASPDNLVLCFDMCFKKIKNELIKRIYIGPKCNITEIDMRLFLESEGFCSDDIKIIKSKATYR